MGRASCGGASSITGRIGAVEPAHAVEAEAVGAAVGPVEDGRRRVAGHRLASPLQPAAVLCALALKCPPGETEDGAPFSPGGFLITPKDVFACVNILSSPLRFIGDVVARFALVLAERSHFEACLVAAFGLQHGVGHGRRGRAAELAQSLGEGPKTVFKAGEGVVGTLGRDGKRQIRVDGQIGRVEEANVLRFYIKS